MALSLRNPETQVKVSTWLVLSSILMLVAAFVTAMIRKGWSWEERNFVYAATSWRAPMVFGTAGISLLLACIAFWFAYASGFWMYAAIALVGWVNPGVYGGNIVYVSELYPTHLRATGVGWFFGIGRIGSFLAPAVVGFMMASGLGKYVLHTFAISYFVSAIALIAVGIETRGLILEKSSATRSLSQNSEKA